MFVTLSTDFHSGHLRVGHHQRVEHHSARRTARHTAPCKGDVASSTSRASYRIVPIVILYGILHGASHRARQSSQSQRVVAPVGKTSHRTARWLRTSVALGNCIQTSYELHRTPTVLPTHAVLIECIDISVTIGLTALKNTYREILPELSLS